MKLKTTAGLALAFCAALSTANAQTTPATGHQQLSVGRATEVTDPNAPSTIITTPSSLSSTPKMATNGVPPMDSRGQNTGKTARITN